jgi:hypothetical protein
MQANPIALLGCHNNSRIVAQRGVFVLFGNSPTSMNNLVSEFPPGTKVLQQIKIPSAAKQRLLVELNHIGYTHSVVFPDLEGLAVEMKKQHGYEV